MNSNDVIVEITRKTEMRRTKIIWKHLLSRRWTILRCELFTKGYVKPLEDYIGVPNRDLLVTKRLEKYSLYNSTESLKEISLALIEVLEVKENFGRKIYNDCLMACKNLVDVSNKVSNGDLKSLTTDQLVNRLDRYVNASYTFTPFLALPNNYEMYITKEIEDFLSKKVGDSNVQNYLAKLMTPKEYPYQVLEQIDLAKIAISASRLNKKDVDIEIIKHVEKYQWLSCYNFDENEFSKKDFMERLNVMLHLSINELKDKTKDIEIQIEQDNIEFNKIVKKIGIPKRMVDKIDLLREFVFLRTYRIEMNSKSNFYLQPLLKEIAQRGGLSLRQLSMMMVSEIKMLLNNEKTLDTVNFDERDISAVIWLDDCKFGCAFGKRAENIITEKLGEVDKSSKVSKIAGVTASKGKTVRGKVRIIGKATVNTFKDGEVLVTVMTSPELVPAIQKSIAVVTDEGGVLCHAAIVSREMNKPCIIGTQNATSVLSDGNVVEVDTDKGMVTIIK